MFFRLKIIFFAFLFLVFIVTVVSCSGKKKSPPQQYDDLDHLISEKYGPDYFITLPPAVQDVFVISKNDLSFSPGEKIVGPLHVHDNDFTYTFRFEYDADPANETIVCAVKGQSLGWTKIILKKKVNTS